MKKEKRMIILVAIFLTLSLNCFAGIYNITEPEYLKAYFTTYKAFIYAGNGTTQLTDNAVNRFQEQRS